MSKKSRQNRPNNTGYMDRLISAVLSGALRPGEVTHVYVRHDDDCPRLKNGECRCVPDIEAEGESSAN